MIRKVLFTALLICFGMYLPVSADVPNGDFESWPPGNNGNPEFWDSPNELTGGFPFFEITVEQTTDSYSGDYAARLTTKEIAGETIPGILSLGELDINIVNPEQTEFIGVPFENRPAGLTGYYKYSSPAADAGGIGILLTRYDQQKNKKDTIAFALTDLQENNGEFESFSLSLQYLSYHQPDSMNIIILSSASPQPTVNSQLTVDALTLEYVDPPHVDLGGDVDLCLGESHTFDVGFNEGFSYLWKNLETGDVLSDDHILTVYEAGIYQAIVQNEFGLPGFDTVQVFMHEAPAVFALEAEGVFCAETPDIDFILGSSEPEVYYSLWKEDTQVSDALEGTGDALVFGSYYQEGLYFVLAEDPDLSCSSHTDTLDISFVPTPAIYSVTGGGAFDPDEGGAEVGLSGSQEDVTYYLYRDDEEVVMEKAGTGEPLTFGFQAEGVYSVEAVSTLAFCPMMMEGEAEVNPVTFVADFEDESFFLYPNPASTHVSVAGLSGTAVIRVILMNETGQLIRSYNVDNESNALALDLTGTPAGVYLVILELTDGHRRMDKLILVP